MEKRPIEPLLTTEGLAEALQVSRDTLRQLVRERRIPFVRITAGQIRFILPAVLEALQEVGHPQ